MIHEKKILGRCFDRLAIGVWLCVLGVGLARPALATQALWQNQADLEYQVPGNPPPPAIDATAFDNESTFSVAFFNYTDTKLMWYETRNTLYYTNNGIMSIASSGDNFMGSGFNFDYFVPGANAHLMADTFYNPGDIRCNSVLDGGNIYYYYYGYLYYQSLGECIASATNIINPGLIDVETSGLLKLTGQNVDLTRGSLIVEGLGQNSYLGNLSLSSEGGVGINTNYWAPGFDLTSGYAYSSWPDYLDLPNSTPYYYVSQLASNDVVLWAVFVQNPSTNVPYKVYFNYNTASLGGGFDTIEWLGGYVDAATGQPITNYLYLNDLTYIDTNTYVAYNGMPTNFRLTGSSTRVGIGSPASSGFPFGYFTYNSVSNYYSYFNAQLMDTTTTTNVTVTNPHGALTNLPGRVEITASQRLNLTLAEVAGMNYMSLTSTNQYDGNAGAEILSPYSDFYLGVTNGHLALTNLEPQALPYWGGTLQAWSGRWFQTYSNTVDGTNYFTVTNDIRVLLVNSPITPTTAPYAQDLVLRGVTNMVISDVYNVTRTLSIDAQNLTLTTNGPGNGAASLDGELNLNFNPNILWASSLPNLLNLTNNGAIRVGNLAQFGSGTPTYVTDVIPSTGAVAASGTLSESGGTNVTANNKVVIGTNQYAFVIQLTNTVPNQIKIAANFAGTMSNLIAAINYQSGAGVNYSTITTSNPLVTAGLLATNHSFVVKARTAGINGNSIATTTTSTNLAWGSTTLAGGAAAVVGSTNVVVAATGYYGAFINHGLVSDLGSTIYADYFLSSGSIVNGSSGSFTLKSLDTVLTNGSLTAGGDVSITTGSLLTSNLALVASRSLTLQVTNLLTDTGPSPTNGNVWSVGSAAGNNGLNLPIKPLLGDLLGTTITNLATTNKSVTCVWAAADLGVSTNGYTNNMAIGQLILDSQGTLPRIGQFTFKGPGTSNALYVDSLELRDQATNFDTAGNPVALTNSANMVIYFARAIMDGRSIADKLNHKNNDHLRWVPQYTGYFSSTNIVYPNGVTNGPFNISLVQSTSIDSDGDGTRNADDPTPFFTSGQVAEAIIAPVAANTNTAVITWHSVPNASNVVAYSTNTIAPFNWEVLMTTNSPVAVPPVGGWPITNIVSYHFTTPPATNGSFGVWVYPNPTNQFGL